MATLGTLPPALENAISRMEQGSETELLEKPLNTLHDVRARLRTLVEKLQSQHAYLLIFGPLKSGKSTLMNAISGSYVSEVTSLPGYPCLVYVSHAEQAHFSVTRYNGRQTVFANGRMLKDVIADSHIALAQQIRTTEERGGEFDPRTHFTEAIRRVDVKMPVQSLAESSTVLVDTPGLYSRMNFGYDVLTREFRDSAACAVFVVKTDNLFLEQVFAEFNQLLDLFSRIFLVINVDSQKRDLQSDGTLRPSAESQEPEKIIEAFKTLSMAGPLRKAYEDKRVRIHAVDLMNAASARLTQNGNGSSGGNGANRERGDGFDVFLRDLTDYLNSSDYTVEFMRDSLRQGGTLCAEVREAFEGEEFKILRGKQEQLDTEMKAIDEQTAAIDRLLQVEWDASFEKLRTENALLRVESMRVKAGELKAAMRGALERWTGTNDSLKALEAKYWNPLLTEAGRSSAEDSRSRLKALTETPLGGAEPAALVMNDLHSVNFVLGQIAQSAAPALEGVEALEPYQMSIREEDVPVRKSFVDWLLFRGIATVRRRLFGEKLDQEITVEEKLKRLPETSLAALHELIAQSVAERFPELPAKFSDQLLGDYTAKYRGDLLQALRKRREQFEGERRSRQTPFELNRHVLEAITRVHAVAANVAQELQQHSGKDTPPAIHRAVTPAAPEPSLV
jgi:hypothetical protein